MRERYVRSGEARLWTCSTGAGTPFLMFNGGPGCDDYLAPVAAMIDDLCEVIRFEPRGCGRSDWDGRYDVETLFGDAEAVRAAYGIESCIVGGHSFGPSAALAYALRYPGRALGILGIAGGNVVNDRTWSAAYHRNLSHVGEDLGASFSPRIRTSTGSATGRGGNTSSAPACSGRSPTSPSRRRSSMAPRTSGQAGRPGNWRR